MKGVFPGIIIHHRIELSEWGGIPKQGFITFRKMLISGTISRASRCGAKPQGVLPAVLPKIMDLMKKYGSLGTLIYDIVISKVYKNAIIWRFL